jgi:hypothetical protein
MKRYGVLLVLATWLCVSEAQTQVQVRFVPYSAAHVSHARAYEAIWERYGAQIIAALEKWTCLPFAEREVTAIVADGVSHSGGPNHPMQLRATYDEATKRSTLVHELGHRHLWQLERRLDDVDGHKTLYLVLEHVWAEVWGTEFAAARVHGESTWRATYDYASAWRWARALSPDHREVLWNRLLAMNGRPATCGRTQPLLVGSGGEGGIRTLEGPFEPLLP